MQYIVKHTCGHSETTQLYGPSAERERRLSWLRSQPCATCKRASQSAQAEQAAKVEGLPPLTGSPKQVEWATRIRAHKLSELTALRADFLAQGQAQGATPETIASEMAQFNALANKVRAQSLASWWIDKRDYSARQLLRDVARL